MNKIKVCHLYYDLMNLYGENANIRAINNMCNFNNIKCDIDLKTINDNIDFNNYDIFYIGCGDESSLLLVLNDILKYKEDIKKSILNNKTFIITGNASELFGSYLIDNGKTYNCLDIFPYYSIHKDIRIVGSIIYNSKIIKEKIIGFQNRCGEMYNIDKPLFKVIEGVGSNINSNIEGIHYKNFYSTYTIGPLLIRNPYLTNYILKNVIKNKGIKYKLKVINKCVETISYNKYLENFKIK